MLISKIYRNTLYAGITICFSFCMQSGFGQTVQTITGKKDILIGEQIDLKIKANLPPDHTGINKWLVIPDSIPHFNVVAINKVDSFHLENDSKVVEQTITITSFDSGRWVFPSFAIEFRDIAGRSPRIFQTDSFDVNVTYSRADSTNQLRDIKPIIRVSVTGYFWYYIIGGGVLLMLAIWLLYRFFRKKKSVQPAAAISKLSPYEEAMQALKKLDQLNLQDTVEIKEYHIRLAVIFKNYLGRKQKLNLMNKTTGDLLINLAGIYLSPGNISDLATALRCTDAVKFAKYQPVSNESEDCRQKIKETINFTEASKLLNN